jgi:predicted dehydrogenase
MGRRKDTNFNVNVFLSLFTSGELGMDPVRIGIVGCGRISDLHAAGHLADPRARIVAACDADPARAAAKAREWGAETSYSDYRQLLDDTRIDAVEIITPQRSHEAMALDALAAGKHVSVQKPMTVDMDSADRMVAAAGAARGLVFKLFENYIFYPPLLKVKSIIDKGLIGEATTMRIKFVSGSSGGWSVPDSAWEWRKDEHGKGYGMQTFDHGHHMWSVAQYLMGEVERVSAWIDSVDGDIDCPAEIMWKYAGAPKYGSCDYSHCTGLHIPSKYYANDEWFEVTGSEGIVMVTRCTGEICGGAPVRLFREDAWTDFPGVDSDWAAGFKGATANFVSAILGEEAPQFGAERGREVLRMDLAIQESARLRRTVELAGFRGTPSLPH